MRRGGRHKWRNADRLSAVSNYRTFRSGAIYRAMNCAATKCALGNKGFHLSNDEHYAIHGDQLHILALWAKKSPPMAGSISIALLGLFQTSRFTQLCSFISLLPWEVLTTKVTVCCGLFIDRFQQIHHLNQTVRTQVEELAYQQR